MTQEKYYNLTDTAVIITFRKTDLQVASVTSSAVLTDDFLDLNLKLRVKHRDSAKRSELTTSVDLVDLLRLPVTLVK